MDNKFLVDTSIIIDFLRRKNKSNTILYKYSLKKVVLSISIITHAELFAGKSVWSNKVAERELNKLFSGLTILPITEAISRNAGKIKVTHGIDLIDSIIASTAIQNKLPLLTLNKKHFMQIAGVDLAELN